MAKIKAVLFDLDGTLRDSMRVIWPATEQTLEAHGISATREEMRPYIHYHGDLHKKFASHVPWEEFHQTFYDKLGNLRAEHSMYDFAVETLKQLHQQGYILGLVTSATTARKFLTSAGVIDLFTVIVTPEEVEERKPHPAPVLLALEQLRIQPTQAVMVGDLPADITAAKAAGLTKTIGITHGFGTVEMLSEAGADYTIDSLEEIPKLLDTISNES